METYLVRFWEPADAGEDCGEVRGFVRRVRDGREEAFVGVEELLERLAVDSRQAAPEGA